MIFGIGIDLAKCSRFEKWIKNPEMIERFFNKKEIMLPEGKMTANRISALCQHYAARFAAKEAFSKALGTGVVFDLRDVFVVNGKSGKPELVVQKSALLTLKKVCPEYRNSKTFISISHEKDFTVAQVIIEI